MLQPVQECQRGALGVLQDACQVARLAIQNRFGRIVLPRPVHERDLGGLHAQPPPAEERARRHVVRHRRILAIHRVLDDALPAVLHRIVHAQREILPLADRIVVRRFGDGVIPPPISPAALDREWVREALDAARVGLRGGMRLAGIGLRLRTHHVRQLRQRKQIAHLGRVEDPSEAEPHCRALVELPRNRGSELGAGSLERHNLGAPEYLDGSVGDHRLEHVHSDARLEAERGHVAVARIREPAGSRPNAGAKAVILARAAGNFDEAILVERGNSAGGCLTANPAGLFGKADRAAVARHGESGADAAHAGACHQDIAGDLRHTIGDRDPDDGRGGIAGNRHALNVNNRVIGGEAGGQE